MHLNWCCTIYFIHFFMLLFMINKNHCFSLVVVNINGHTATKTCIQKLTAIKQLARTCKCTCKT